jgi:aminoglycoside 3-N-acetyltransferase
MHQGRQMTAYAVACIGGREKAALLPILKRAGVPRDGVLIVHSAIARLSRQRFRAEAMIEALLDHLAEGTLVMPAMTWRTVTPANPVWDELWTPSHTGVMSEIFRKHYAGARSIHPTHSVAGYGRAAKELLARHHIDETPVSANSPYGLMRGQDAHVLMLGVGLESCTAIHLPEEIVAPELYLRPPQNMEVYECRSRHGSTYTVRTRRHWRLDRDFPQFATPLIAAGLLQAGAIEDCPYGIVPLQSLYNEVTAALQRNPRGTLRQGGDCARPSSDMDYAKAAARHERYR